MMVSILSLDTAIPANALPIDPDPTFSKMAWPMFNSQTN